VKHIRFPPPEGADLIAAGKWILQRETRSYPSPFLQNYASQSSQCMITECTASRRDGSAIRQDGCTATGLLHPTRPVHVLTAKRPMSGINAPGAQARTCTEYTGHRQYRIVLPQCQRRYSVAQRIGTRTVCCSVALSLEGPHEWLMPSAICGSCS
jgi:hypothetical protein